jgi:hypothetical protein
MASETALDVPGPLPLKPGLGEMDFAPEPGGEGMASNALRRLVPHASSTAKQKVE